MDWKTLGRLAAIFLEDIGFTYLSSLEIQNLSTVDKGLSWYCCVSQYRLQNPTQSLADDGHRHDVLVHLFYIYESTHLI